MAEQTNLLVDDDLEIARTVRSYLVQEGCDVRSAYNGLDALVMVRDQMLNCPSTKVNVSLSKVLNYVPNVKIAIEHPCQLPQIVD